MNPSLMGAEGAAEICRFLAGTGPGLTVTKSPADGQPLSVLRLARTDAPNLLSRHLLRYEPEELHAVRPPTPFIPSGTLLVADQDVDLTGLSLPADSTVLIASPSGWTLDGEPLADDEDDITARLAAHDPQHIRIVADLGSCTTWLARDPGPLLRLHDAMLLAARAAIPRLAAGGSFYVLVLHGADDHGIAHPYSGLFSGFLKTLEIDPEVYPGIDCLALLTSSGDVGHAAEQLDAESRALRALPTVMWSAGQRLVTRLRPAPVEQTDEPLLAEASVVVGAGASRGIGMAMLRGLAARCRPEIFVLGSNDLDDYDPDALTEDEDAFKKRRYDMLRTPGINLGRVNAELRRMTQAREVRRNLTGLADLCGPDRVHYMVCDTTDENDVARCAAEILARTGGRVDLLLNVSGMNRSATLQRKRLRDFRAVRDLKVYSYLNLKRAFDICAPRLISTSSIAGAFGMYGESDYSSANDFLFTAGTWANKGQGVPETSIGWGLWGDTGRGAESDMANVLRENADMAPMSTTEGLRHFFAEISQAQATPCPVFFGEAERRSTIGRRPRCQELWAASPTPYFLDEIAERSSRRLVVFRDLSAERDGYLRDHLIDGHPTVPGFVLMEVAAQAAAELVSGRVAVAVEDFTIDRFVRVYGNRVSRKKITAELVRHTGNESAVEVRIGYDQLAPDGRVLARDLEHASMRVLLRDTAQVAPRLAHESLPYVPDQARTIRNPYQVGAPFAQLSGVFSSAATLEVTPAGNRARMRLNGPRLVTWFRDALLPTILSDAVAQISIGAIDDGWSPVAVPRTVGRVDFYGGLNDAAVAARGDELTLSATRPSPQGVDWAAVTAPDGTLIVRIQDMTCTIIGYLDQETGEYRTAERHDPPAIEQSMPSAVRPQLVAYDPDRFVRAVTRMVARAVPAAEPHTPVGFLAGKSILLLGDEDLARSVARLLTAAGAGVSCAGTAAALHRLAGDAQRWDGIVDLNLTGTADYRAGDREWEKALALTTAAIQLVYPRWFAEIRQNRHWYIAIGHQDGMFGRSGDAPLVQPLSGAWTGLAKALPVELPTLAAKAIDLDTADPLSIADAILAEAGAWDGQEICYRKGERLRLAMRSRPIPPQAPTRPIGPDDLVLISGGGRGIGFALALELAERGARVVVTGRQELPQDADAPAWLTADQEEFTRWRHDQLRRAHRESGSIARARVAIDTASQTRALRENLHRAAAAGLPITYRACDITSADSVRALVEDLPAHPTVLVHNAGTYRGVRFSSYSVAEVIGTGNVKINGLTNLLEALAATGTLRMLCNVGSMSGRSSGMVGHVAYTAANNALTQLGYWAAQHYEIPVHTVCWPTWERMGNIVNYTAAATYSSTMDPADGVAHWIREIETLGDNDGESAYFGRIGVMLRPGQLRTVSWPPDHPDIPRLAAITILTGEVQEFAEHRRFVTRHVFHPATEPHLPGGSLPLPQLLEYVLAAGDWVRPEGQPHQHLHHIADLICEPATLRQDPDLRLVAVGSWLDSYWQVQITVTTSEGHPALSCALRYADAPAELPHSDDPGVPLSAHYDSVQWSGPHRPDPTLPHQGLSELLAHACAAQPIQSVTIEQLTPLPGCVAADAITTTGPKSFALTATGATVLTVEGLSTVSTARQ